MTNRQFHDLFGGPPRKTGVAARAAAHGPGGEHPGGDRRGRAADGPRTCTGRPGMKNLVHGRRRGAQLRRQRPAAARRARSRTSGFSRPPAMPAARSARRCSSGISCSDKPRQPTAATRSRRACSGPRIRPTRSSRSSTSIGAPLPALRRRSGAARAASAGLLADGEGRRLVPRPDGVRPARPRRAQHPRRCAVAADAGDDEPQDQVPRELPAVRAVRAARARARVVRRCGPAKTRPYMLLVAPVLDEHRRAALRARTRRRCASDPDLVRRVNIVRSTVPAITHVDYSARVQTVDERHGRYYRLMKRVPRADRLPGPRQHELQPVVGADRPARRRRPTTRSCSRRWTCSCSRTSCCTRTSSRSGCGRGPATAQPSRRRRQPVGRSASRAIRWS